MARKGSGVNAAATFRPSAEELRMANDPRFDEYGYTNDIDAVSGMYKAMGQEGSRGFVSPFVSLPTAASGAEFFEAIQIFGDPYDPSAPSMTHYDYSEDGFNYNNLADQPVVLKRQFGGAPAPITLVPTSTTNPERPRTVAAGYDKKRQVLTTVFRDGTYYNYYSVEPTIWARFKQVKSKGKFIADVLDSYPRGVADVTQVPDYAREALYRVTRTSQLLKTPTHSNGMRQISRASRRKGSGGYR